MNPEFFLCPGGGWRAMGQTMMRWPTRLAGFAGGPDEESTDVDSLWREWDTPMDMTFDVVRPGGHRVRLTKDGEIPLPDATP